MCVCVCSDHKVAVVASLFWILKDFPRMVPPLAYGLRLINCKGLLNQFTTAQVLVDWKSVCGAEDTELLRRDEYTLLNLGDYGKVDRIVPDDSPTDRVHKRKALK